MIGELRNGHGERLDYTYTPGATGDDRVVVVMHGVTSHKDRPWLIALCEGFAAAGVASLRFSFAGNGGSEGRFEDATISKEVDDLGAVVDALEGRRVGLAGHSMGGAVGVLRTARDPRVHAFASLAGMVHVRAFMERLFGHLVPGRDVMLDKPECPLSKTFLDDARRVGDVLAAGASIRVPWRIVHGTADDIVPIGDGRDMAAAAPAVELIELDGVDHRFTGAEAAMTDAVVDWMVRALVRSPG